MSSYPIRTRRWTRGEYEKLIDTGVLHADERIELIGGQMIVAEPQGDEHALAVELVGDQLRAAFGPGWAVRQQSPMALDEDSRPEPDVFVVSGRQRDYRAVPSGAALLVEVSDSSLAFDRRHKAGVYARARIAEYWIVNLVDAVLETYRDAATDPGAEFGWSYGSITILRRGAMVVPLARPDVTIPVADLLP